MHIADSSPAGAVHAVYSVCNRCLLTVSSFGRAQFQKSALISQPNLVRVQRPDAQGWCNGMRKVAVVPYIVLKISTVKVVSHLIVFLKRKMIHGDKMRFSLSLNVASHIAQSRRYSSKCRHAKLALPLSRYPINIETSSTPERRRPQASTASDHSQHHRARLK